jgi:hypothetical protein
MVAKAGGCNGEIFMGGINSNSGIKRVTTNVIDHYSTTTRVTRNMIIITTINIHTEYDWSTHDGVVIMAYSI